MPLQSQSLVLGDTASVTVHLDAPEKSAVTLRFVPIQTGTITLDSRTELIPRQGGYLLTQRTSRRFTDWEGVGVVKGLVPGCEYKLFAFVESPLGFSSAPRIALTPPTSVHIEIPQQTTTRFLLDPPPPNGAGLVYSKERGSKKYQVNEDGIVSITSASLAEGAWNFFAFGDGWTLSEPFGFITTDPPGHAEYKVKVIQRSGLSADLPKGVSPSSVQALVGMDAGLASVIPGMPRVDEAPWATKFGNKITFYDVSSPVRVLIAIQAWNYAYPLQLVPGVDIGDIDAPLLTKGRLPEKIRTIVASGATSDAPVMLQQYVSWANGFEYWYTVNGWLPLPEEMSLVEGAAYRLVIKAEDAIHPLCEFSSADLVAH